jgi:hypothetical protein
LTIDPYIYESDGNGVRRYETNYYETNYLIECDEFETAYLAKQFPEDEYGSDFWVFAEEVEMPSRRIAKVLKAIDLDPEYLPRSAMTAIQITEPVTMA